ncbi:MAG: autotransporter domain-containing protein [Lentisphaerales bacterium]|nr:autotransporter domain-containing protein [Lentisphaerales bacterium]
MNIFFKRENKGHFASGIKKAKCLLMTALMLLSQIPILADTPDLQDADGNTLTYSSGSIISGNIGNVGLDSSNSDGKQDYGIFILDSTNIQLNLSGTDITTYGYAAHAVRFSGSNSANNTVNMTAGNIITKGLESDGIHSVLANNFTINFSGGTITTGDPANPGLTDSVDYGEDSYGLYAAGGDNLTINISGTGSVTTYGQAGHGAFIFGDTSDLSEFTNQTINMTGGSITTRGRSARGLSMTYSDNSSINMSGGAIITGDPANPGLTDTVEYGEASYGIYQSNANNSTTTFSGSASITTYGHNAYGIYIIGTSSDPSQFTNQTINMTGGTITTRGRNARGISLSYSDNSSINISAGTIITGDPANVGLVVNVDYGESAYGANIHQSDNSSITMNGGSITTYGQDGNGLLINGDSTDSSLYAHNTINMTGGTISTVGRAARPLYSRYADNSIINFSGGSITTGHENNIGLTNTVEYGEDSHGIYIFQLSNASINLSNSASITTYGYSAHGIRTSGLSSNTATFSNHIINLTAASITTSGQNARGLSSQYSDNTTINLSGTSITTGDADNIGLSTSNNNGRNADGIYIFQSNNNTVNVSENSSITTYGQSTHAFLIQGLAADTTLYTGHTVNISGGALVTRGQFSRGIRARYSDCININFSGGSITTGDPNNIGLSSSVEYGKTAHGIEVEQSNDTIVNLSNSASITTYGHNAHAVYVNGEVTDASLYTRYDVNMTGGTLQTTGRIARGIYSYYADQTSIKVSGGSITTGDENNVGLDSNVEYGENSHGLQILNSSYTTQEISGSAAITTYGRAAHAVYIQGNNPDSSLHHSNSIVISEGTITAVGDQSKGIYILRSDNSSITVSGGTIITGDPNYIGVDNNVKYGNDAFALYLDNLTNGYIDFSGGSIITYGENANGIKLNNADNSTLNLSGTSSITTHGDTAHGITVNSNSDDVILTLSDNASITSADDGIYVDGTSINLVINISDSVSINSAQEVIRVTSTAFNSTINVSGSNWTFNGGSGTTTGVINEDVADNSDNLKRINSLGVTDGATISASQNFTGHGAVANNLILGALTNNSDLSIVLTNGATIDVGTGNDSLTLIDININTSEIGTTGGSTTLRGFDSIYLDNSNLTGNLDFDTIADEDDNTIKLTNNSSISGSIDAGVGNTDTLIIGSGQTLYSADIHLESMGAASGEKFRNFENLENYGTLVGEVLLRDGDNIFTIGAVASVGTIDFGEAHETNGDTLVLGTAGAFSALKINNDIGSGVDFLNLEQVLGNSSDQEWAVTANDASLNYIDLADGSDTLIINNGTTVNGSDILTGGLYRGIDNLTVNGTITGDINLSSTDAGSSTINLGSTAIIGNLLTGTGSDILHVAGGAMLSSVNLGAGNNTFNFNGNVTLNGSLTATNSSVNIDSNTIIINGTADLKGADITATVLSNGAAGNFTADTIILKGGTLHLNAGSGFQPGDLVDVNLTSIFVSDDIQDENGQQISNTYSVFDSLTHSAFLRVRDGNTLVYEGFEGALENQQTNQQIITALDDNSELLDAPIVSNFISTATADQISQFAEAIKPQTAVVTETLNLAVDTAALAINNRFSSGTSFTPQSSGDEIEDDIESSFWQEGLYSKIDKETTSKSLGYEATVSGISFGVDKSQNGLTLGLAYSFYNGRTNNRNGRVESEIHQISFYSQKEFKEFYFKAIAGGGLAKNDSERYIASVGQQAKANYDSYNFYLNLELGKNYEVKDMIVTPFIGVRYSRVENDSYEENDAGALNLDVDKTSSDSYEGLLGLRVAKLFLLDDQSSIVTHLEGSVSQEFGDKTQSVTGRFSTGQIDFKSEDTETADYHYNINGSITWYSKENIEIQANYFVRFAEDYLEQSATVDLTIKF